MRPSRIAELCFSECVSGSKDSRGQKLTSPSSRKILKLLLLILSVGDPGKQLRQFPKEYIMSRNTCAIMYFNFVDLSWNLIYFCPRLSHKLRFSWSKICLLKLAAFLESVVATVIVAGREIGNWAVGNSQA